MTFSPVILGTGYAGWQAFQRNIDAQKDLFAKRPDIQRDVSAFKTRIPTVTTVSDVVTDRNLRKVALGAFDLTEDLDNTFFIKRVMEDGTSEPRALANRLSDDRYKSLAQRFSPTMLQTGLLQTEAFTNDIAERYVDVAFERAVGEADQDMRFAMALHRLLPDVTKANSSDAAWFRVMASQPLRTVFEAVLNLPSSFGQLDVDRQLETFKEKARDKLGTDDLADLTTPDALKDLTTQFLVRRQLAQGSSASAQQVALTLVSQIPRTSILNAGQ